MRTAITVLLFTGMVLTSGSFAAGLLGPSGAPPPEDAEDQAQPDPAPASGWTIPKLFSHRYKRTNLEREGGTKSTERAVLLALTWLSNHQSPNGSWGAEGFQKQCKLNLCGGTGNKFHAVGVTGLALLAYLGAGQTPFAGTHKESILKGLTWLMAQQTEDGCFGPKTSNTFVYNHAIAARAMAEAYGLSGSPFLRAGAQRGIDFILKAQNPYLAWRYGIRPGDNDTSVSIWMFLALHTARAAGLEVDPAGFDGMKAWIEKVTEPEYGRVGYTARGTGPCRPRDLMDKFPGDKSESLTAAALLARVLLGEDPSKSEMIAKHTDLLQKCLPLWDEAAGSIDMYYWYLGSLAMMQVGGKPWGEWAGALFPQAVDRQRKEGDEKGSWDPVGPWGRDGGRIYSTALMTLILESPYLYARQFKAQAGGRRHRTR